MHQIAEPEDDDADENGVGDDPFGALEQEAREAQEDALDAHDGDQGRRQHLDRLEFRQRKQGDGEQHRGTDESVQVEDDQVQADGQAAEVESVHRHLAVPPGEKDRCNEADRRDTEILPGGFPGFQPSGTEIPRQIERHRHKTLGEEEREPEAQQIGDEQAGQQDAAADPPILDEQEQVAQHPAPEQREQEPGRTQFVPPHHPQDEILGIDDGLGDETVQPFTTHDPVGDDIVEGVEETENESRQEKP